MALQFGHQIDRGLVDARMVADHELREVLHRLRLALAGRELAGIDIDLIGRHDDSRDLRIRRPGTLRPCRQGCGSESAQRDRS